MDSNIARALATSLVFFELSTEEELDPDTAVEMMEVIGSYLPALPEPDRLALADAFRQVAKEFPEESREYVASIPEACGMV